MGHEYVNRAFLNKIQTNTNDGSYCRSLLNTICRIGALFVARNTQSVCQQQSTDNTSHYKYNKYDEDHWKVLFHTLCDVASKMWIIPLFVPKYKRCCFCP